MASTPAPSASSTRRPRPCMPARSRRIRDATHGRCRSTHDVLRVRRRRPRGAPVRAPGVREHLHPDHEPDHRRVRGARRGPRGRRRGARGQRPARRPRRCRSSTSPGPGRTSFARQPLRRHVQPVPLHAAQARHHGEVRRRGRTRDLRRGDRRATPSALFLETIGNPRLDVADIPAIAEVAHAGRRPGHRRQHLRPAARPAHRARRRHRHPLRDQVDRRPRDGRSAASSSTAATSTGRPRAAVPEDSPTRIRVTTA